MTLLAHRRILLHCFNPLNISLWMSYLMLYLRLEKIKYTLMGSMQPFCVLSQRPKTNLPDSS